MATTADRTRSDELRHRRLTASAALFALHLPAFVIALIGSGQGDEGSLVWMLPFLFSIAVATVCWLIYLFDIARDERLSSNGRVGWIVALFLLPQALLIYWWLHVRRTQSPPG